MTRLCLASPCCEHLGYQDCLLCCLSSVCSSFVFVLNFCYDLCLPLKLICPVLRSLTSASVRGEACFDVRFWSHPQHDDAACHASKMSFMSVQREESENMDEIEQDLPRCLFLSLSSQNCQTSCKSVEVLLNLSVGASDGLVLARWIILPRNIFCSSHQQPPNLNQQNKVNLTLMVTHTHNTCAMWVCVITSVRLKHVSSVGHMFLQWVKC